MLRLSLHPQTVVGSTASHGQDDRVLHEAPVEASVTCWRPWCSEHYLARHRTTLLMTKLWTANPEVSRAMGLPRSTLQQYVRWQIVCCCGSSSLEWPAYTELCNTGETIKTFLNIWKLNFISISWGGGAFVTLWFDIYALFTNVLTYLLTSPPFTPLIH